MVDSSETERIRRLYDKEAPKYDRQISFFERLLFKDGREWACSQATGDVLPSRAYRRNRPQTWPTTAPRCDCAASS